MRTQFFLPEGPRCPFNSQDPHWCSGEVQHSTQAHPRDEELGRLYDHSKSWVKVSVSFLYLQLNPSDVTPLMLLCNSCMADQESSATLSQLTGTISPPAPSWLVLSHFLVCGLVKCCS